MLFSQILLDVMVDKHNKHVPLHLYIKMMDDARNINHPAEPSRTLTTQKMVLIRSMITGNSQYNILSIATTCTCMLLYR